MKQKSMTFIQTLAALTLSINVLTANPTVDLAKEKTMSVNVCDINTIYNNKGYNYSLPKLLLQSFLSGIAFGRKEPYSKDEAIRLNNDINQLYQNILEKNPLKEKIAIITAGAPGAGKTIKLKQDLEENRLNGKTYAYVCPDDVCLQGQKKTYQADIEKDKSPEARTKAYDKWRPGSNAATHLILANLIRKQYGFYFGSTSSAPQTGLFFKFLKEQGYEIRLIHVIAPDDVRWESIKERDKTFIQTTEQDVKEKGNLLPQRINDTFLKYADRIEFYYRGEAKSNAKLAATWIRNEGASEENPQGTLQIDSHTEYEEIKKIHNAVIETLKLANLTWEETVEKSSKIFY